MIRLAAALLTMLLLVGCAAAEPFPPQPVPSPVTTAPVPEDGALLSDFGFKYAPEGISVPRSSVMSERIDQVNNVTIVFTAPGGVELAAYLRETLPEQGFEITADGGNSLLFQRGHWQGAFTTEAGYSGLSFRTDREPAES